MNRDNPQYQKQLMRFLGEHDIEKLSDEELDELIEKFTEQFNLGGHGSCDSESMSAADHLELAMEAKTKKARITSISKALELEPDNLDAKLMLIECTAKNTLDRYEQLKSLVDEADKKMEAEKYFQEYTGQFWGVWETRPYMRIRHTWMQTLTALGMFGQAVEQGEDMLRLCENDNLGVRFTLMHLYAHFESRDKALALNAKYENDFITMTLFPLSILFFKLGDFENALLYLKRLRKENPGAKEFIQCMLDSDYSELIEMGASGAYVPRTLEELAVGFVDNSYLYLCSTEYFEWANKKVRK